MCLPNNRARNAPPVAQPAAPAPTRDSVATGTDPVSLVEQSKSLLKRRMGVFGNIRTTPLGDALYGAFARFGK